MSGPTVGDDDSFLSTSVLIVERERRETEREGTEIIYGEDGILFRQIDDFLMFLM